MSNALSNVSSQVISEAVDKKVTEGEMLAELPDAEMPHGFNYKKWKSRKKVGQYLGHDVQGAIAVTNFIRRDQLERVCELLLAVAEDKKKPLKQRLDAARQLKDLITAHVELAGLELKVGEILAMRETKLVSADRAPTINNQTNTSIRTETVIVQIPGKADKVEGGGVPS